MSHPNLLHLEQTSPKTYPGGVIRGASREQYSILEGQQASMYSVRLEEDGVREPHWHPNAWEFGYCISGRARMTVVAPKGHFETFEVGPGDAVFVPQGYYHYFENIGSEELHVLLVFNTSMAESDDDIGLAASIGVLPDEVLDATFGVSAEAFRDVPKLKEPVTIAKRSGPARDTPK